VVTDHDTIEGARHVSSIADARVIIGQEITTQEGDVLGLFLRRTIPAGLRAREAALAVRQQGGLVFIPHPFIRFLGCGLRESVWDIVDLIDAVEVNNAQNIRGGPDRCAEWFAARTGLPRFIGSDSHTASSIAPCYQLIRDFSGPADFLDALRTAELVPGRHPVSYFVSAAHRALRHVLGLPFPDGFGINHGRLGGAAASRTAADACRAA
jgi:predicted metal-dependent phosphoesterase TrpH